MRDYRGGSVECIDQPRNAADVADRILKNWFYGDSIDEHATPYSVQMFDGTLTGVASLARSDVAWHVSANIHPQPLRFVERREGGIPRQVRIHFHKSPIVHNQPMERTSCQSTFAINLFNRMH